MTAQRDRAVETSDVRSRQLDEATQQLAQARQQLQEAQDELRALQAAQLAQAAAPPPAGTEEREQPSPRALEAARQADLLVQELRLEAQAAEQQAAAQLTALTSELHVTEMVWAHESQEAARARASLESLRAEVHEAILAPLIEHWPAAKLVPTDQGLAAEAVVDSMAESEEENPVEAEVPAQAEGEAATDPSRLDAASAHVRGLLVRDALERQLLVQALAQAEKDAVLAADAAAAAATPASEPPSEPVIDETKGAAEHALRELQAEVQAAREAAAAAADAAQERLQQQQATALLSAVLHNGLAALMEHHAKELGLLRPLLAQSQVDVASAKEAEAASKQENAALLNTLAGERDAAKELERQARCPRKSPSLQLSPSGAISAAPRALLADQGT